MADSESADARTPLLGELGRPPRQPPRDGHTTQLRACHSPWRLINQTTLAGARVLITGYMISVCGVALKYKMEREELETVWQIPFQFSTVAYTMQMLYNLQTMVWTIMHLTSPQSSAADVECHGHQFRDRFKAAISPSSSDGSIRKYLFSTFYTATHTFAFANTIMYWGLFVPSGHGGFPSPEFSHHPHGGNGNVAALYDGGKGLFEEDDIKPFAILNVWTINSVIAMTEIFALNSIRRPTPVGRQIAGIAAVSGLYLVWAELGKLATGHAGVFFIDPAAMGDSNKAAFAASAAFIAYTLGIFSSMYGLIAMRESMTTTHDSHHP